MKRKKYLIYWLVYNAGMWEGLTPFVKVTRLKARRKALSFSSMKEVNGNIKSFRKQNDARVYSIYQITSYEFSRCFLIQEILLILQNPKLHYRFYNFPPLVPILNTKIQSNFPHTLSLTWVLIFYLWLQLPNGHFSSWFLRETLHISLLSLLCDTKHVRVVVFYLITLIKFD